MARASTLVKPDRTRLVKLQVLRREQLTEHFVRVTVGGGSIEHFVPRGYDQWFRLFVPTADDAALDLLPDRVGTIGYLRYLRIDAGIRPVLRNYTVRAYREDGVDGPEIDIDIVLHAQPDGSLGPGAAFGRDCVAGDWIGLIDEGLVFNPGLGTDDVLLAADETGVPGVAGILASLPEDARGLALLEVPVAHDVLDLDHPAGVDVRWLVRGPHDLPGDRVLEAVRQADVSPATHAYAVGEASLAAGARRHLVGVGVGKDRIDFCGYWRAGSAH